jgi:hypothetical protein
MQFLKIEAIAHGYVGMVHNHAKLPYTSIDHMFLQTIQTRTNDFSLCSTMEHTMHLAIKPSNWLCPWKFCCSCILETSIQLPFAYYLQAFFSSTIRSIWEKFMKFQDLMK